MEEKQITEELNEPEIQQDDVAEAAEVVWDWYIVQVYSGKESQVKFRLEQLIAEKKLNHKVNRVLVPEEETIEIKNNKRVEKITKIFPGYVFLQMILDEEIHDEIRRIPGVSKFIGSKTTPTPVKEDEILKVLRKAGDKTKKIDVDFEIDDMVKVTGGPFRGYTGPISEISPERGKLKALISIFGRETPVELEFDQVEKAVE